MIFSLRHKSWQSPSKIVQFAIAILLLSQILQHPIYVSASAVDANDDNRDCSAKVEGEDQPKNLSEFASTVRTTVGESWSSILKSYVDVVRSGFPYKDKAGDVYVGTIDEGTIKLEEMVEASKQKEREEKEKAGGEKELLAWELVATDEICKELKKSRHDLYRAFLVWSTTDSMKDDQCEANDSVSKDSKGNGGKNGHSDKINVSKAHRRLEMYTLWMREYAYSYLFDNSRPFSPQHFPDALEAFKLQFAVDSCKRLVWYFDVEQSDLDLIRSSLPPNETLLLFMYLSHQMLFNIEAQDNGLIFVEDMGHIGFGTFMQMLPFNIGLTIDKFMIGVLPIKAKAVVFVHRPMWFDVAYGMLSMFLTKQMKSRVVLVNAVESKEEDDVSKMKNESLLGALGEIVGKDNVPRGFAGLEGDGNGEFDLLKVKGNTLPWR